MKTGSKGGREGEGGKQGGRGREEGREEEWKNGRKKMLGLGVKESTD